MFDYDKDRGQLIWKNPPKFQPQLVGKVAGTVQHHGHTSYNFVKINGKPRLVHRLIWIIEKNEQPDCIDHIDGNGLNNHISNLRNVNKSENNKNKKVHRSGQLFGCTQNKRNGKWIAQIRINGKQKTLGTFKTQIEAHQKYLEALNAV